MREKIPISVLTRAHKLRWYGESCIALSDSTNHAHTKRVLRALAADLLIEAEKQSLQIRRREAETFENEIADAPNERAN
jgi:hypothetical protein